MALWLPFLVFLGIASPAGAQTHRLCDPGGEDCRDILIAHIRAEKVRLDVAFWFMEDSWMASEIIKRWQAGVPVRILMDTRANATNSRNIQRLAELSAAGIPMRERSANGIMHWKMMLFAGQGIVEFSGANYSSDAWVPAGPAYTNYVDESILFTSQASIVNSFKTKFDDLWTNTQTYRDYANVAVPRERAYDTYPIDPSLNFVPYESYFWRSFEHFRQETKAIDVVMYRITNWRFSQEMISAAARGVAVRLMTEPQQYRDPKRPWHSWNIDLLYMNGVQVKNRKHAGLNHQKSVLLRGQQMAILGSSNWTSPSSDYQEEHNLFTTDAFIYGWLSDQFTRKWTNGAGVEEYTDFVPLPPDAPTQPAPASGATGVSPARPTLSWYGGSWAHKYDVYVGTSSTSMELVAKDLILGPSESATQRQSHTLTTDLLPQTTYYWKVVGKTMANMVKESLTWSFRTADAPPPPPTFTLIRGPYVQQVSATSAMVVWATNEAGAAQVTFSTQGGPSTTVAASSTLFAAASTGLPADYRQHVAVLSGLSPATRYDYRLVMEGQEIRASALTTAPAASIESVTFAVLGESGVGSTEQREIAARIAEDRPGFVLHTGNVAFGASNGTGASTHQTVDAWFFGVNTWVRDIPIYPALGTADGAGQPFRDLFVLPSHGATATYPDHAERYYSFDHGPVHVVVLDTGFAFADPSRRAAQLAWLEADLQATTRPWRIAVLHRSPYSSGPAASAGDVRSAFAPLFQQHGVRLVFGGGARIYERTRPLTDGIVAGGGVTYVTTGGGGAPLESVTPQEWTAQSDSAFHYVRATTEDCILRVSALNRDSDAIDSFTIRRCDKVAPTVSITSPPAGAVVQGVVTIFAEASDDDVVSRIELLVNGTVVESLAGTSVGFQWNTASVLDGTHVVRVRAFDPAGNAALSTELTVTVDNPEPPTISPVQPQTMDEDGRIDGLAFQIDDPDDPETADSRWVIVASPSDPHLFPAGSILIGGSGTARSISLTPAADRYGQAVITLSFTSPDGTTAATAFDVVVRPVNDAPLVADIARQRVTMGQAVTVPVAVFDIDHPPSSLAVRATASDHALLPEDGIRVTGAGESRALLLTPAPDRAGTTTVAVEVTDGDLTSRTTFELTVEPCTFSVSPSRVTVGPDAASATVQVTASMSDCAWSAEEDAEWLVLTGATGRAGSGGLSFTVAANAAAAARAATVTIRDLVVTIEQQRAPAVSADPAALNFGAVRRGTAVITTPPQVVRIVAGGPGTVSWSVLSRPDWLLVEPSAGASGDILAIRLADPATATTGVEGSVVLGLAGASHVTLTVPVRLRVQNEVSGAPIGHFDTPGDGATGVTGSIAVTGWALDDVAVGRVAIYRSCVPFEDQGNCQMLGGRAVVFIGDAAFVDGARPDVEAIHATMPAAHAAGWGYLILTNMFPHVPGGRPAGGQGTYTLYAVAIDLEGQHTNLGAKTIVLDNDNATRPFGAIDTPTQGGEASGRLVNFGWALSPSGASVPSDGVVVYIDGLPVGRVTHGQCRGTVGNPAPAGGCNDDVAALFPGHANIASGTGAIGSFVFDTATLADGLHSIAWGVTDDRGRSDGIGSRYFRVRNGRAAASRPAQVGLAEVRIARRGPLVARVRTGFDPSGPWREMPFGGQLFLAPLDRLEIELPASFTSAVLTGPAGPRGLPAGARFEDGRLTWVPGPAFFGVYTVTFSDGSQTLAVQVRIDGGGGQARHN